MNICNKCKVDLKDQESRQMFGLFWRIDKLCIPCYKKRRNIYLISIFFMTYYYDINYDINYDIKFSEVIGMF